MSKQIQADSSKVFPRDSATHSLQAKLVTSLPISNNVVLRGSVIRGTRLNLGMTLEELGQAAGISHSYVSLIENGLRKLTPKKEAQLLAALERAESFPRFC